MGQFYEKSHMEAQQVLRIVDSLHRDKNINKEVVFHAIESAMVSAARKHFGEEAEISFEIDRANGKINGQVNGEVVEYEEIVGRIGAQTAKQVIIQKVREAERDALIDEFDQQLNQLVSGTVQRNENGVTTVSLGSLEAILPRSEQIQSERYHPNERVRAVISEVKAQGSRVKVILSRNRPILVQRLFEQEIPEISDGVVSFNAIAREPGKRCKVAVSSTDSQVDCVGACVGVRGSRIKNIVEELSGERIDIVRYDEDPMVLIPNALQPAQVDEVILCQMLGRAIVLVQEDQLSLAIGKHGQNVRLASKLCGWDIEIMTQTELESQIERAVIGFTSLDGCDEELANRLVGEGYLSYDDLSVIEPVDLMEMGEITEQQVDHIVNQAEARAEEEEKAAEIEKERRRRERELQAMREDQEKAQAKRNFEAIKNAPAPNQNTDQTAGGPSADDSDSTSESKAEGKSTGNENETTT